MLENTSPNILWNNGYKKLWALSSCAFFVAIFKLILLLFNFFCISNIPNMKTGKQITTNFFVRNH